MTVPAEPTAEPQSVTDVQGTLSQVAREAAATPAPEPAGAPEVTDDVFNDLDELGESAEPTLGEPAPETPEVPADPFAELGADRPTVEAALRLHQATQSEDGIIQLFLEAGKQLGVGLDKIEALFTGAAPAPAAGEPEYDYDSDPDRPVTMREIQELQRQQAEAARQAQATQARTAASTAVQSAVKELGLTMEDKDTQVILTLGNEYLPQGGGIPTPEQAAEAVRRGHADYLALIEKQRKEYIAEKRKAADTVPSAPAGSAAPSEPAPAEPRDSAEAIKLARQKLRAKGLLA